ncbi:MAG: SusC/RagA family TonB-linked outer membrane protein [Ferruginibacter sp.]
MRKLLTITFLAMLSFGVVTAQTRLISGKVTDPKGVPVPGATVKLKAGAAVAADDEGKFQINAKTGDILTITSIDFGTTTAKVGSGSTLDISMTSRENKLEEVVITAQGIRKKAREIGYSYAKISSEEITVGRSPQLAQALSGKISGLAIYNVNNSVDPSVKIVLRGYRSLTGNNDALVVVDGMQTTSTILALINPNDIESVSILKGGQAATLYGSAGINGAVVITTRKGKGKLKVAYSNATNFEQISFLPEFQTRYGSGSGYYPFSFGQAGYSSDYLVRMKANWRPYENQQFGDEYDGSLRILGRVTEDGDKFILPYSAIDNVRMKSFDVGVSTNNQVSFSGGDETSTFYLSAENQKINGVVPNDKSERTGARFAATKTSGKISAGFNASYTQADYDRTSSDFYFDVINQPANLPLNDLRDWQTDKFANPNGYYNDYYNNPYFNADNNRMKYKDANLSGNLDVTYKALPWLSVYNRLGIMNNSRTGKNTTGKFIYTDWAKNSAYIPEPYTHDDDYPGIYRAITNNLGSVTDYSGSENIINNEFQLQLAKDFGDFANKMVLGYSVYQRALKGITVGSSSVVVPDIYNVSNRQGELTGGEFNSRERRFGYYADLTTTYKGWLTFNGSFRFDETSRFFKPTRKSSLYAYPYYGAALAFIITDALPFTKSSILNYAKLRVNYNKNGNDNIDLYGLDLVYNNGANFPYGNTVGLSVGNVLPDAELKPEFVTSYEAGGEFQLFNDRVNLDVTAYTQKSVGQVITVKIPNSTGFNNLRINVGETKNWGYEADLKMQIVKARNLRWELGIRYSYNDNKVVDLFPGITEFQYGGYTYSNTNVIKDSRFPMLKTDGYQYAADGSGRRLVSATTGYPLRQTTLSPRGGTLPRHIIGAGSRVIFKDFALSFNFEYRGGNFMFTDLGRQMTFTGSGKWTENRAPQIFPNSAYVDASGKTVANTTVQVREPEYALWVNNYRLISENFVVPAWFIKLRDVNLSYNVPAKLLAKTKVFSAASIAIYGRNVFTIVDKSNYYTDPEFSALSTANPNGLGINGTAQTPPVRQYGFNVNLVF